MNQQSLHLMTLKSVFGVVRINNYNKTGDGAETFPTPKSATLCQEVKQTQPVVDDFEHTRRTLSRKTSGFQRPKVRLDSTVLWCVKKTWLWSLTVVSELHDTLRIVCSCNLGKNYCHLLCWEELQEHRTSMQKCSIFRTSNSQSRATRPKVGLGITTGH